MSAMLGLSGLKSTSNNHLNCSPTTNVTVITGDKARELTEEDLAKVSYPPIETNPYANLTSREIMGLANENEALKLIIQMIQDNPLIVNKYVIADDTLLIQLVKLLTCADDVQIDAEDIGSGCSCGANVYRKVNAIYVIVGNETKNLKYDYPKVIKDLGELRISTKFVF